MAFLLCTVMTAGMLALWLKKQQNNCFYRTASFWRQHFQEAQFRSDRKDFWQKWVVATDTVFKPFEYTNDQNELWESTWTFWRRSLEDQGFEYELQSLGWDAGVCGCSGRTGRCSDRRSNDQTGTYRFGWIFLMDIITQPNFRSIWRQRHRKLKIWRQKIMAVKNGTAGADFANSLKMSMDLPLRYLKIHRRCIRMLSPGSNAACVNTPIMAASIKEVIWHWRFGRYGNDGAATGLAIMDENQELLDMFNKTGRKTSKQTVPDEIITEISGRIIRRIKEPNS